MSFVSKKYHSKNCSNETVLELKVVGSFGGATDVLGVEEVGYKRATKKYHRAEKMSY